MGWILGCGSASGRLPLPPIDGLRLWILRQLSFRWRHELELLQVLSSPRLLPGELSSPQVRSDISLVALLAELHPADGPGK